jgi:hypothetical protein
MEELEDLISAGDLAAMMPDYEDEDRAPLPTVLRPVRHRGLTAAALKAAPEQPDASFIDRFTRPSPSCASSTSDRFEGGPDR